MYVHTVSTRLHIFDGIAYDPPPKYNYRQNFQNVQKASIFFKATSRRPNYFGNQTLKNRKLKRKRKRKRKRGNLRGGREAPPP